MLAFQPRLYTPQYQPHAFAPSTPSPLSPRRTSHDTFSSITHVPHYSSMNTTNQPHPSTLRTVERKYRPELHNTTRGALSQKRRAIFHRKIQSRREDASWARRGEELERLDDRNEWWRWEQEALSLAPSIDVEELDEGEMEMETEEVDVDVDEVVRMEERELAALVEMMDVAEQKEQVEREEHFGSDEEDYEDIFAGLEGDASHQAGVEHGVQREGGVVNPELKPELEQEADGMDLS